MEIASERENNVLTIKPEGRISGLAAQTFQDAFKEVMEVDDKCVIVDFEEVAFISSAGLRVFLLAARALSKQNAALKICELSEPVKEVFTISGFDKLIPIYSSYQEALDSLKE